MRKTRTITCINCGNEHTVESKSRPALYCSFTCQHEFKRKAKIVLWLEREIYPGKKAVRWFLTKDRGEKCACCNNDTWLDKPITLEIEHKDGNSDNNHPDNLELLCPNCHSYTPTYKAKNKGNGRHARRLRYKEGKSY